MKKLYIGFALVALVLGIALVAILRPSASIAAEIVSKCASETERATCYENTVPKLYPEKSIPEVFDIVREIRASDPSYQFCHVLAHKLGRDAALVHGDEWLSLMPLNPPDGMCSNGFMHGLIIGHFRDATLDDAALERAIPDFARACEPTPEWQPTSLDQAICYHGLGHLFMFITFGDIPKSLTVCARVSHSPTGDFSRVCREGVFMQIYQPLEPDDYALIDALPEKPTKENYRRLCSAYTPEDEGACLREAWPLFREEIFKGAGASTFCAGQPNRTEEDFCYESVTTIVGRMLLDSADQAKNVCDTMPEERQELCYLSVAQSFIEEDRSASDQALTFCKGAPERVAVACARTLLDRINFYFGSQSEYRSNFCRAINEHFGYRCR